MVKKIIFLSYRRGDSPGYVKSLEKELEQYYGEGSVFRDVKDIAGGTKWKKVIEENLQNAAALLLIIGPRWDSIWRERINDEVNYVEYELNYANKLKVPVIPVTLNGSSIAPDTDLKSVAWLRENQNYDMSDKQDRWENDFKGLIQLLENITDIDQVKRVVHVADETKHQTQPPSSKKSSWLKKLGIIATGLFVVLFLIGLLVGEPDPEPIERSAGNVSQDSSDCEKVQNQVGKAICASSDIASLDGQLSDAYKQVSAKLSSQDLNKLKQSQRNWVKSRNKQIEADCFQSGQINTQCVAEIYRQRMNELRQIVLKVKANNETTQAYRDLTGTWQGSDGTTYLLKRTAADRFSIESPGYGSGEALFIKNLPNKIRVTMYGIGRGEFSISNSSNKIIGSFTNNDGQQTHDTLIKISP